MFAATCANTAAMCLSGSNGSAMNSRHACNARNLVVTGLWCKTVNGSQFKISTVLMLPTTDTIYSTYPVRSHIVVVRISQAQLLYLAINNLRHRECLIHKCRPIVYGVNIMIS